jgi:hypothetical protein
MCTVSYVVHQGTVFITSNRDEQTARPLAFSPELDKINNTLIAYPKDPKAGGTWFAVNEYGAISVLLNGGFEKHIPAPPYRKSRGLVLLEIASTQYPAETISEYLLHEIEPFTLVLYNQKRLTEFRWDGKKKYFLELDEKDPHLWSSATLYSTEIRTKKLVAFEQFLSGNIEITSEMLLDFHANEDDPENGFRINRSEKVKTLSTTQALFSDSKIVLKHKDLVKETTDILDIKVRLATGDPS